jgi:alpha-L-rhamnosidase
VLPLAFGLVPDDIKEKIFAHLVDKIENDTHGHIGTGLIGGQYLMRVLTENGRADLAYEIASQKDYPSWGYMIEHGATTIWELWNGNTADPTMNSGNHVMLVGDLVVWFYENLAGIKSDPAQPGFKHIIIKPTPVGDLTFVKATHHSPYGLISSEWHRDGNKFDWQIEIPANTTATIYVPAKNIQSVTESGKSIKPLQNGDALKFDWRMQTASSNAIISNLKPDKESRVPAMTFLRMDGDCAVLEVGGGKYHFTSK